AVLRSIGASEADMEKGQMRVEPNISIRRAGSSELGVKTELKNINSFRALHRAISHEVERQVQVLESGGAVVQETRGWSEDEQRTFSQRSKEFAEDYRYFPEPDLPPLELDRAWIEDLRRALPDLPASRRARLMSEYGLPAADAATIAADRDLADLFEAAARASGDSKRTANWVIGEVAHSETPPTPDHLAEVVTLVGTGKITREQGREVLAEATSGGGSPSEIVARRGLAQVSGPGAVRAPVEAVIAENPKAVQDYRAGKVRVLDFLVAQVLKRDRQIDRSLANDLLKELLGAGGVARVIALILPLCLDTFAVAAAIGMTRPTGAQRVRFSILFAAFEGGMPISGVLVGAGLGSVIGGWSEYVAIAALVGLGVYMLWVRDDDPKQVQELA